MDFITRFLGIFYYIMFLCISCFSCKYTSVMLGNKLNITTCLAMPLVVICTLQVYLTYFTGFYTMPSIGYWLLLCLYIIITAIIESLSAKFISIKKYPIVQPNIQKSEINVLLNLLIAIFVIYACYDSYRVVSNMDLSMVLQEDGQDEFGTSAGGGFFARVFLMIMATYYLGYGTNWKSIVVGLLCFFPSLVVNTKGVIFIPIIAAFIVRYLNGQIKDLKKILISIGFIGTFIFFASYMWEYFTLGENPLTDHYRWQYIGEKLLYYLTAGVQGFSVNLDSYNSIVYFDKVDNITIAPFSNFLSKFGIMNSVRPVTDWTCFIGNMPLYGPCDSNVNTYVGTIYLYNSFLGGLFLHIFWVVVTTILRIIAIRKRQPFTICLFALFATAYVLGWFEFYFMQTFWVYMVVMVFILNCVNLLKCDIKNARV